MPTTAKTATLGDWPGWLGPRRDGRVSWLPEKLPAQPHFLWRQRLSSEGVGGLAIAENALIVGCRDTLDQADVWYCLNSQTGAIRWQYSYPARGRLDYGNSARATPLIHDGHVWLFGAMGHLSCVRLEDGGLAWQHSLREKYQIPALSWGLAGSPLLVDGKLIVQPGGTRASLIALQPFTGATIWESAGEPPGHATFTVVKHNHQHLLIGYDKNSLGAWDARTGTRRWKHVSPNPGDFHVPSPVALDDGLLLASENNGTRWHPWLPDGTIHPQPVARAVHKPDIHTPIVLGQRVFGLSNGLYCLDLANGLKTIWLAKERPLRKCCAIIGTENALLIFTFRGELILLDPRANQFQPKSRLKLTTEDMECWSFPALAHHHLFVRLHDEIVCLDLTSP